MDKYKKETHIAYIYRNAEKLLFPGSLMEFRTVYLPTAGNLDWSAVTVAGEDAATEEATNVLPTNILLACVLVGRRACNF